jgi:hypothetical protein
MQAFVKELGTGLVAIVGITLGLLLIAVFFEVGVDSIEAWWHPPLSLGLALGISGFALLGVYAAVDSTLSRAAAGWLGMLSGRPAPGFSPADGNGARALASASLLVFCAVTGLMLFRHGVSAGALNWAVEGLFLVAAGLLLGFLPIIPRLYFMRRHAGVAAPQHARGRGRRKGRKGKARAMLQLGGRLENGDSRVAYFACLAILGIGLSMAVAGAVASFRLRDGRAALAYGDWAEGCVDPSGDSFSCARDVRLTLIPAYNRRLRVEPVGCPIELYASDGAVAPRLGANDMRKLGFERPSSDGQPTIVFDPVPGQVYEIAVLPKQAGDSCYYAVRYLVERRQMPAAEGK